MVSTQRSNSRDAKTSSGPKEKKDHVSLLGVGIQDCQIGIGEF